MAKKNKNKSNSSYTGPLPEDNTRTGETNYIPPANNNLEALKFIQGIDFLNLNKYNKSNLPPSVINSMADNTLTGEFNDYLGNSTAIPNIPQSSSVAIPTAPQTSVVPTTPNGITNLVNTSQTAQAQQLGIDPASQAFIESQKAAMVQPTEIGAQGMGALYPGMKHNINVGNYSGSILGSGGIYVPGGDIMAIDPILAKRQKEEQARIAQAKMEADTTDFKLRTAPQMNDQFFQEGVNTSMNKLNNEFMTKAKEIYGNDFNIVMKNPQMFPEGREYIAAADSLEMLVKQGNQMTTLLADMQGNIDKGDKFYSPETMQKFKEYQDMIGDFENGDPKALIGLRDVMVDLQGGKVLDEYFKDKDVLSKIKGKISGDTKFSNLNQDFDILTDVESKSYNENIKILSEELAKDAFSSEVSKGLYTVEDIAKRLKGYFQNEYKSTAKLARTTVGDGSSGGSTKVEDLVGLDGAPNNKLINGQDYSMQGEVVFQNKKGATARQSGLIKVNADGTEERIEGILEFRPVTINALRTVKAKAGVEGGVAGGSIESGTDNLNIPVITAKVIVEEDEIGPDGDPTGKKVKVEKDMVLKVDETMEKTLEANPNQLGYEKGVIKSAVEKITGQTKKNSNLAPSKQTTTEEVDYSNY